MLVLLGEVGGVEEYLVCDALKNGRMTKPIVAWCIGTCSDMFTTDVQFGHAGARYVLCCNIARKVLFLTFPNGSRMIRHKRNFRHTVHSPHVLFEENSPHLFKVTRYFCKNG